jgi:hypothetical protein
VFVTTGHLGELDWEALSIDGVEAISELYQFTIRAAAPADEVDRALHGAGDIPPESALLDQSL